MKTLIKKRFKLLFIISLLFLVINVSISLAYLSGNISDTESVSTIALKSDNLNIIYSNNSSVLNASNITPGFEMNKKFTVTSDFGEKFDYYNHSIGYTILLIIEQNEFDNDSIDYSLSLDKTSSNDGITAIDLYDVGIKNGKNLSGVSIGTGAFFNNGISHVYNLKISYKENGINQSHEIGCNFKAHLMIQTHELLSITFNLDGGHFNDINLVNNTLEVPKNSTFKLPIPEKENYIFKGWTVVGGDSSADGTLISAGVNDFSMTANWVQDVSVPIFSYTGSYSIVRDDNSVISDPSTYIGNWKIRFLSNGTLTFSSLGTASKGIDIFVVGGGGNGTSGGTYRGSSSYGGGSGGGGGAVTATKFPVAVNESYNIVVGGAGANSYFAKGGTQYFTAVGGSTPAQPYYCGSGCGWVRPTGSGGGRLSGQTSNYGASSVIVRNGASGNSASGNYEFNGSSGILYGASGGYGGAGVSTGSGGSGGSGGAGGASGGGAGGKGCSYICSGGKCTRTDAASGSGASAYTGSGGGGGGSACGSGDTTYGTVGSGGAGGSGIVIIRDAR